jgi:hypothetical protein
VDNQLMGLYNMAQFNQSLTMGNVSTLQLSWLAPSATSCIVGKLFDFPTPLLPKLQSEGTTPAHDNTEKNKKDLYNTYHGTWPT